jgi:hypothetical protein
VPWDQAGQQIIALSQRVVRTQAGTLALQIRPSRNC